MTRDRLEATYESDLLDEQSRILYPLELLAERESETALGHLFQYWRRRCDGDKPPREHEFSPHEILPPEFMPPVSWLDVTPEDPLNFVFRDHVSTTLISMANKPLRAVQNKLHMTALAAEYTRCKSFRRPMYHEIDQIIDGISRQYVRLLVPVIDRKSRVGRLFSATRVIFSEQVDSGQSVEA